MDVEFFRKVHVLKINNNFAWHEFKVLTLLTSVLSAGSRDLFPIKSESSVGDGG